LPDHNALPNAAPNNWRSPMHDNGSATALVF
jgi:hypothetical protein